MSFLCTASLHYDVITRIGKLTEEAYANLRSRVPDRKLPPTRDEVAALPSYTLGGDVIMDNDEVQAWVDHGIQVDIKKMKGVHYSKDLPQAVAGVMPATSGTTIINVSCSSVGLFDVRRVTWLEDACTEDLQRHLNDGWRLLAVCPPNDSRRPTYILGRIGE